MAMSVRNSLLSSPVYISFLTFSSTDYVHYKSIVFLSSKSSHFLVDGLFSLNLMVLIHCFVSIIILCFFSVPTIMTSRFSSPFESFVFSRQDYLFSFKVVSIFLLDPVTIT
jgi:hypothetical protein